MSKLHFSLVATTLNQKGQNHLFLMAYLKLFFPGLSNSNSLCHLLLGHSALSTLLWHGQEQSCQALRDLERRKCESYKKVSLRWHRLRQPSKLQVKERRERIESLSFVRDPDSNDFWSSADNDGQFVHAIQLQQQECSLSEVETVRSQLCSSRKWSLSSETESLECLQSLVLPIE